MLFARTYTYASYYAWQGQAFTNHIKGFFEFGLFDTFHIFGNIKMNRAGIHAGRCQFGIVTAGLVYVFAGGSTVKFISKIFQSIKDRQRSGLADATFCRTADNFSQTL